MLQFEGEYHPGTTMNDKPDITAFLASAVHDMKNSLNPLLNFLEESIAALDGEARRKMSPMLYDARRVSDNLVGILAIYQLGHNFYPFELTENSIESFISEIDALNKSLLDSSGIELAVDFDPELSWYFDRDLVVGIVTHALNNAARYARDKVKLSVKNVDGELLIWVEDNGPGYPQELLLNVIKPGNGVDFSSGNTGLGLYFASMVASLHKNRKKTGAVSLENGGEFGGACFILRLP